MIKFKYKASKATIDLGTAFQQKPGLNLSMFLAENKPSCWLLIIMKSLDLPFLSSSVIPLITGWSSHLPSRRWSLGLPLFYPLLHSLISHQSPISAHKKTQADSGDLGWPLYRSVPVPRGASGAHDEPKVTIRGGKRGYDGKRDFFLKRMDVAPFQHEHTTQSRLSKDNQLRCKCSPEGGETERSPVSFASEHKVCLWWGQLVTAERSQSVHLSQPLLHILTEKADSCIHPGSRMIHSSLTHAHTHATQTHLDPWQELRGLNTITFSSLLEGRKNSGATRRLLLPCGKIIAVYTGLEPNKGPAVEQEVAWAASSPPRGLAGSQQREEK